jgi:integrase
MSRRGHYGGGSIDPSGEGSWRIRYRISGRRYAKIVQGSKTEAAKELRRLLASGDDGKHVAQAKLTLGQWIEDWLTLKARSLSGQTLDRYEDLLRKHVVPVLGSRRLQSIGAADIDKLYSGLPLAAGTLGLLHRILKSCLRSAIKKKLLAYNPADDTEKLKAANDEVGLILDEDQLALLVRGFVGHSLYPIVAVAAFTGMRKGEALALRWVDIDLDACTISISRNVEEIKVRDDDKIAMERRVKKPKSARGTRTIQIDPGLAALLRSERERHLRLIAGVPDGASADVDLSLVRLPDGALAFPEIGGAGLRSPHSVYAMFRKRARELGLMGMRFHDLRASHATIMLDRMVPVHVVARRIGDDPATLLRWYAKRTKKADTSAANVIGTLTQGVL